LISVRMINVVHGEKFMLCQYTGEPITEKYKIPMAKLKGWIGCYGSPSVAAAAIFDSATKEGLTAEEAHELYDQLESTIRRKPGMELVKYTINVAPPFRLLSTFGGNMSLQEFHAIYGHDDQARIFYQKIPEHILGEFEEVMPIQTPVGVMKKSDVVEGVEEEDETRPSNCAKRWGHTTFLPVTGRQPDDSRRYTLPRCANSWIEFFRNYASTTANKDSVVVYLHPTRSNVFGIGNPNDWLRDGNKEASDALGKVVVFGRTDVFHKTPIRSVKRNPANVTKKAK